MKTLNPFVPVVPLIAVPNRTQHGERFKTWFMVVLCAHLIFVLGLLVRDYRREAARGTDPSSQQARLSTTPAAVDSVSAEPAPAQIQEPISEPPPPRHTAAQPPRSLPQTSALTPALAARAEGVYRVKPGDTLRQIARECGVSVKALKGANALNGERLTVGQKLNLKPALYSKS